MNHFVSVPSSLALRRKESVRFVSVPDFSTILWFGSVRQIAFPGSTQFGLRFSDAAWLGPVRFGSVPRRVPAGSRIKQFG